MPENSDFSWNPDIQGSTQPQTGAFNPPVMGETPVDTVHSSTVIPKDNPDFTEVPSLEDQARKAEDETKEREKRAADLREKKAAEKKEIHTKIQDILAEFNNKESEIPLDNVYWGLLNRYRSL